MDIQNGNKFNFGKHKGEFILEVIHKQPWYIEWILENVKWFKLNKEEYIYYNQTKEDWLEAYSNVFFAFPRGTGSAKEMYKVVEAYKRGDISESARYKNIGAKAGKDISKEESLHEWDELAYLDYYNYVKEFNNTDDVNPYNIVAH